MEPERIKWNWNSCLFPSEAKPALKPGPTVVRIRKPKFLNRDGYEKPKWVREMGVLSASAMVRGLPLAALCTHTHAHTRAPTHTDTHIHTRARSHTHTCVHTHAHTHTHVHTHTRSHTTLPLIPLAFISLHKYFN